MIPQETIDKVFAVARIEEVVSDYVSLKRRGANLIGLCPFHNEKSGSFSVSQSKQIFHCFGCGAGGNVISFLMKYDNLTFTEALQQLAEEQGLNFRRPTIRRRQRP